MLRTINIAFILCLFTTYAISPMICKGAAVDNETSDGLRLLASFDLKNPSRTTGTLPTVFCGRTDLVYDLTISAVANWNSNSNTNAESLFTLGRNMNGLAPNSVSVMMWSGNILFARLTPGDLSDTAQSTTPALTVTPGEKYTIHVRWDHDSISLDCNGQHIGDGAMASDFVWPANRPYFIGFEDNNLNPWTGEINSGTLRVYETRIDAQFAGGRASGYFVGPGAHRLEVTYPRADGGKIRAHLTLSDINNKPVIANLAPSSSSDSDAEFRLPRLPYGWYSATAALDGSDTHKDLIRSIVITPEMQDREPIAVSPFGIADEGILQQPGQSNPAAVDAELDRMSAMGMRWLRVWVPWSWIEPSRGVYDWTQLDDLVLRARQHGLQIYPAMVGGTTDWQSYKTRETAQWYLMSPNCYMPLKLADWSEYMTQFARHYRGRISIFQVWNEPDARNGFFPFDPAHYAQVLKTTSDAVRSAVPGDTVSLGGFCAAYSPNLIGSTSHDGSDDAWGMSEFYAQNPQADYNIVDCHFYTIDKPGQSWDGDVATVQGLRAFMKLHGDGDKPLWDSEVTFATGVPGKIGSGFAQVPLLSGEQQAARLVQLHVQSQSVGISRTFWYSLRGYAGLINNDFSPLPSYAAHVELSERLFGMHFMRTLSSGGETRVYLFGNGRSRLVVAWTNTGEQSIAASSLLPNALNLKRVDMMGNVGNILGTSMIQLTNSPVYIVGIDRS